MGGSVFTQGPDPLHTPRMPPDVYHKVKDDCHAALRMLFLCVASPIEGPAKQSFGDIDILVAWKKKEISLPNEHPAKGKNRVDDFTLIERALGAKRVVRSKGDGSAHFALPWPTLDSDDETEENDNNAADRHIQVDVTICASLPKLQWMLFKHAHGDLWNMIGSTIRPYGLTVDEEALYVRIPEVELHNRTLAKIRISSDPSEVLDFLGFSAEQFPSKPFADENDLFEYVASTPLFWIRPAEKDEEEEQANEDKRKLKSNDRRRMNSRACYRRWVEDFIPRCRAEGRFAEQRFSREDVRQQVFDRFRVQQQYNDVLRDFTIERQRQEIWRHIKERFPNVDQGSQLYRGCLRNALKRILVGEERTPGQIVPEKPLKQSDGTYIMENVWEFIETRHEEVGTIALNQHGNRNG